MDEPYGGICPLFVLPLLCLCCLGVLGICFVEGKLKKYESITSQPLKIIVHFQFNSSWPLY